MKIENLIIKLIKAFPNQEPPKSVTKCAEIKTLDTDFECRSIENDFANRDREPLSDKECSMMIIDSALIRDDSLIYFIPRLAKELITGKIDSFLFGRRLEKMHGLNPGQMKLIEELIDICRSLDDDLNHS